MVFERCVDEATQRVPGVGRLAFEVAIAEFQEWIWENMDLEGNEAGAACVAHVAEEVGLRERVPESCVSGAADLGECHQEILCAREFRRRLPVSSPKLPRLTTRRGPRRFQV